MRALYWLMLSLLPVSVSADLRLGGTAEFETAVQTTDGHGQKAEVTLLPDIEWRTPWGFDLTAIGRLRADGLDRLEPGSPALQTYDPWAQPQALGTHGELALREFYADIYIGSFYLRAGKQQIVWGKTDGLKLLDRVNPQSFREFILPDFEDSRIPQWALRAELPIGPVWQLQLIAVTDVSVDRLPPSNGRFAITSPELVPVAPADTPVRFTLPDAPTDRFGDGDAGAKLSAFIGGWDVTLNYLYHYVDRPAFARRATATGIAVTPSYYRTHTFGGSAANAFDDFTLRSEVAVATHRRLITNAPEDEDGLVERPEASGVIGVDWMGLSDTIVSTQLFASWVSLPDRFATRDQVEWDITQLVQRTFNNETLTLRGQVIHDVNGGDGLLRASLTYDYRADLVLGLGVDVFYGRTAGRFGQFDENDRLTATITQGF